MKIQKKWLKPIIILSSSTFITALAFFLSPFNGNAATQTPTAQTMILEKSDLTKILSTSGVVKSANTQYVFSAQSKPIKEIHVSVGDTVKAGDILAHLDMSAVENEIAQAELNLIGVQRNADEEERNKVNAISSAQISLEAQTIALQRQSLNTANAEQDLADAETDMQKPFDSYLYDRAITDATVALDRREADFETAQQDLEIARNKFDDFIFQNNINEAEITLKRRLSELSDAEAELDEEKRSRIERFDNSTFQQSINDAERNLQRRREDEEAAAQSYWDAWNNLNFAPPEAQESARNAVQQAQNSMTAASRAVEDAESSLTRTRSDLTTARRNHNSNASDVRDNAITAAETRYNNAQNAADDAQRALDKATADLERAKRDAETKALDSITSAFNNLRDAERTLERAITDKERAITDYITANETKLSTAQRNLADSKNQLQSAQNNLKSAQDSLSQAGDRPAASRINVDLQTINLERLETELYDGIITAPVDGVITEINASVGAVASGVLFIIEDIDNLYVSAKVREHSLSELELGQPAFITTEVTGNSVYDAQVTFISPRSVSPEGSTSVEFEIHAAMDGNNEDIRIGMNAFINVITDTKENIFSVPLSAIYDNGESSYIYVSEADEKPREIAVTVGLKTSTHAEILADSLANGTMIFIRASDARGIR